MTIREFIKWLENIQSQFPDKELEVKVATNHSSGNWPSALELRTKKYNNSEVDYLSIGINHE